MRCGARRESGPCLYQRNEKKRTVFYVDGFNLYHGLLKGTPYLWLDMAKFATSLLPRPEEHDIVRIKYFTARIKYNPAFRCKSRNGNDG